MPKSLSPDEIIVLHPQMAATRGDPDWDDIDFWDRIRDDSDEAD